LTIGVDALYVVVGALIIGVALYVAVGAVVIGVDALYIVVGAPAEYVCKGIELLCV